MKPRVKDIVEIMEELAPSPLAETWDRIGLQMGDAEAWVDNVVITLDIMEGMAAPGRLIICHHPMILKPLEHLKMDCARVRMLASLLREGTSVLCAHTNLDSAGNGTAQALYTVLEQPLGLQEPVRFGGQCEYVKLVVFVPEGHEHEIMRALGAEGAGWIGKYSHCTFRMLGTGTFMPGEGSSPHIGTVGRLEEVKEYRLETIVEKSLVERVIKVLLESHPYEEVAYDLYPVTEKGPGRLGRLARLKETLSLEEIGRRVSDVLSTRVRLVGSGEISTVAMVPGSGSEFMEEASLIGAECLITGDIRYHHAREAEVMGFGLVDAGHYSTEVPVLVSLADALSKTLSVRGFSVPIRVDRGHDPFRYRGLSSER